MQIICGNSALCVRSFLIQLFVPQEATQLRDELQAASFKIDEKVLVISYAKFSTNPTKSGYG